MREPKHGIEVLIITESENIPVISLCDCSRFIKTFGVEIKPATVRCKINSGRPLVFRDNTGKPRCFYFDFLEK